MNDLFNEKIDWLKKELQYYKNEKIGIYGIGEHTKWLLNSINTSDFKVIYLIDKSPNTKGENILGFSVMDITESINNVKVIVISSQTYENEIYERIKYIENYGVNIIKIYDYNYIVNKKILNEKEKCVKKGFALNLGGGNWHKLNWKNVDWYAQEIYIDNKINLLNQTYLPFDNNSVSKVFTSHLIEHLSDEKVTDLFNEVYRIMQPGAILRIACPDADLALEAYKNNDFEFFDKKNEVLLIGDTIEQRLVNFFASFKYSNYSGGPNVLICEVKEKLDDLTKEDFIKWCVSQIPKEAEYIAHINGFYYDKLKLFLSNIGFKNINKSKFRNSNDKELRGEEFDNRPLHSLFVECYKNSESVLR